MARRDATTSSLTNHASRPHGRDGHAPLKRRFAAEIGDAKGLAIPTTHFRWVLPHHSRDSAAGDALASKKRRFAAAATIDFESSPTLALER